MPLTFGVLSTYFVTNVPKNMEQRNSLGCWRAPDLLSWTNFPKEYWFFETLHPAPLDLYIPVSWSYCRWCLPCLNSDCQYIVRTQIVGSLLSLCFRMCRLHASSVFFPLCVLLSRSQDDQWFHYHTPHQQLRPILGHLNIGRRTLGRLQPYP